MVKSKVKLFYEEISTDKGLQNKMQPIVEKMRNSKNLKDIIENELIPVAKYYGFELTLKDFFYEETELKEHLSLGELKDVSGGVFAKPFIFTTLTLFGLLGVSAAAGQAHAADIPNQNETVYMSDSSNDESANDDLNDTINQLQNVVSINVNNDNVVEQNPVDSDVNSNVDTLKEPYINKNISRNCAAIINGKEYKSLQDAISAAKNGDTVVIENDIILDQTIHIKTTNLTIIARG